MDDIIVPMPENGRVVIPAEFRQTLGFKPGDRLLMRLEADGIRITSAGLGLDRARKLLRERVGAGRSLAGELIAERRAETKHG